MARDKKVGSGKGGRVMDHILLGKQLRHFQYPAMIPNEDVLFFEDGLREIIPDKIEELNLRAQELEDVRAASLKKLKKISDPMSRWFAAYWAELDFGEYQVIQKWLRYWLKRALL